MSSSNVSSVTSHFPTANEGFITTTGSTTNSGATEVELNSVSGLTNGKVFVGIIEPGVEAKEQTFTGIVDTAGSQITNVVWTRGANTSHAAGSTVVDYVTGTGNNMITKGILEEHNQDGTHGDVTADSLEVSGTSEFTGAVTMASWDGWQPVSDSWTYASGAGTNVGTITVPSDATTRYQAGMRLKFTQTTVKYAIITKVEATTLTIYMGTDYTIANAAISAISVSNVKAPFGFPLDPAKWSVVVTSTTQRSRSANTYASLSETITVPTGVWKLSWKGTIYIPAAASNLSQSFWVTLSTSTSAETIPELTTYTLVEAASGLTQKSVSAPVYRETLVALASSQVYTLIGRVNNTTTSYVNSNQEDLVMRAVCAYL